MNIIEKLIPTQYKRIRPGTKLTPIYITIHETANLDSGADAAAHARLLYNGNGERVASWHFTVDEQDVYQSIPTNEVAYHAGSRKGNHSSIGIEICVNQDGDFAQATRNAAHLVRVLMAKHQIPLSKVVQHNHWTGKDCPATLRKSGWSSFISMIKSGSTAKPQPFDTNPDYHRLLKLTDPMMCGEDVKRLQLRLRSKLVDGIYGPATKADVVSWQRVHDGCGKVVRDGLGLEPDGIVGPKTWKALFGKKS